ncbi:MAG: NtaA/DmoA family FMN-dependent monooxygenase [Proteobacteria bacterium]|nr:NtaA/DmoA family FMN-dependent monooxygenase [Pseudomonadota bacterium]
MNQPLLFSAFVMNTPSHILHGVWRQPGAGQVNFNSLKFWVDLARELEAGLFDVLFFADVHGVYGNIGSSYDKHVTTGLQIPSNDPSVILSALAYNTEHLGFAFTSSIIQEHPYNFARKISTLDHASNGRIAWNIVTNGIPNGARNFGFDDIIAHDERYRWADEYVEVTYKLWEGSWDEGALLQDRHTGWHADPAKIHRINHHGERYRVEGPHLVSPSPQRTPLLFQAGSSEAGMQFAAANAEAQFLIAPSPKIAAAIIEKTRKLLPAIGRPADSIKFFQGLSFVVGSTEEEVARLDRELDEAIDYEAMITHLGGAMGIDLADYALDHPLTDIETEGIKGLLTWVKEAVTGREPTVRDIGGLASKSSRISGTPEQIIEALKSWQAAGIEGVNVINATIPGSYTIFIEELMPLLRTAGLAKQAHEPGTLRRKIFGHDTLPASHHATKYRGAFNKGS